MECTYWDGHQLLDLLNLVPSYRGLQSFEDRFHLGHGQQPLLRSFASRKRLRNLLPVRPSNNNLVVVIIVIVIFLEQSLLIVYTPRNNLHPHCVLFGGAVDLLQVIVIAVLCQPSDDVLIRPVYLQGPGMLVENVVLRTDQQGPTKRPRSLTSIGIWST